MIREDPAQHGSVAGGTEKSAEDLVTLRRGMLYACAASGRIQFGMITGGESV